MTTAAPNDPPTAAPTDDELLDRQRALQAEADAVHADLGLDALLGALGTPVRVGSSALGLMVRRDLDVTVVCPRLDASVHERVAAAGARLALHERVRQVRLRNDTGAWNEDPAAYPDGLYLGLDHRCPAGYDWTLDLWFVDDPDRQPDLAHLRDLPPRLTRQARTAILRIKHAWADRPEYGRSVRSWGIYRAVLDEGVRTPEEFERHRAGLS
ncbi:hypothetical protein AB0F71_13395 [Kitasatospora sp. NPDC028055]|uniref:hypothetical protein n=1 Tax=Kitasatospora sp. NPDC028055 TaxID=3155653 RepID=UPI0033F2245D